MEQNHDCTGRCLDGQRLWQEKGGTTATATAATRPGADCLIDGQS
jgi:hypothetical protein